jgi:CBS domain-containing protein
MPRKTPVAQLMSSEVLSFSPEDNVRDAMLALVERDVDGGPVVDGSGQVVGMLSTDDIIVQESRLHFPTVIELFGATLELPGQAKRFNEEIRKALGATVGEVMTTPAVTVTPEDTMETAASLMHDQHLSRLPVVRDGALVGIVARGDIVRVILHTVGSDAEGLDELDPDEEAAPVEAEPVSADADPRSEPG